MMYAEFSLLQRDGVRSVYGLTVQDHPLDEEMLSSSLRISQQNGGEQNINCHKDYSQYRSTSVLSEPITVPERP